MPEAPLASVVLPVRNEADFIERALTAVLSQDYGEQGMEIVVVDGLSEDGTREIVERVDTDNRVRIIDNPRRIAPTALNLGVRHTSGEVIVRVDGHCVVAPDFVRRSVEALMSDPKIGCVGGALHTVGDGYTARTIALAMSSRFGVGGSAFRVGVEKASDVDTVAFPAFRRETLAHAGPFDEELVRNQDDEYSYRLRKLGFRVVLDPRIRSTYFSRASIRSLFRQYYQYGFWKVRVLQKHPFQMRARQFVPPLFVASLLVGLALVPWLPSAIGVTAGAYLLANLTASVLLAAARGPLTLPLLPVAFAAIHVSYGLGFLAGLVRFAGSWRQRGPRLLSPTGNRD